MFTVTSMGVLRIFGCNILGILLAPYGTKQPQYAPKQPQYASKQPQSAFKQVGHIGMIRQGFPTYSTPIQ
jgi:hypothetical protein